MTMPASAGPDTRAGWAGDDVSAAVAAFRSTSHVLADPCWQAALSACPAAPEGARDWLERWFRLDWLATDTLFTGYYEPELDAALHASPSFPCSIHSAPPGLAFPWLSRADIAATDALRGYEIAWLRDPLEAFLLQVQGSGRLKFDDGRVLRVGYASRNGHPYRSIGAELIRRGVVAADAMSAQAIRAWARDHPDDLVDLLHHNPSYVFFRSLDLPPGLGPLGTMGHPVTPGRSLAVDPDVVRLGSLVWAEGVCAEGVWGEGAGQDRLMVAQDTGSAIAGPGRADVFIGSGAAAGEVAGRLCRAGRMALLRPRRNPHQSRRH